MANRRMFSKSITNSSQFLMMPSSSQNLYFHIGMNADDDGFCEHFAVMRMTDSKPDDLKILQAKNFVNVFDDKVLIILDWKENNYLRTDRYTPSKYLNIYKKELKRLSSGIPKVDTGKERIGEDRLGKERVEEREITPPQSINYLKEIPEVDLKEFITRFEVSFKGVKDKAESLFLYCQSKGKTYKNYRAFLLNALKKDFPERKILKKNTESEIPMTIEQKKLLEEKRNEITRMMSMK